MTIKEQYRFFLQQLKVIYTQNEATILTDWIFESLVGVKRFEVVKNPDQQLSHILLTQTTIALKALLQHKPIQYVTGEAWFYNMKLRVDEDVLIPRPETEELVELVVKHGKNTGLLTKTILDIGTGSGCIAIAIKQHLPAVNVTAIDVSNPALAIAQQNALAQQADIQLLQVDFLDETQWEDLAQFDVIVSNPPYIPLKEKEKMDQNVTGFEPHQALFVPDKTPLLFYEKIAAFARVHLNPGGKIFLETHEGFAKETAALFIQDFSHTAIIKDIFGKERMVVVTY